MTNNRILDWAGLGLATSALSVSLLTYGGRAEEMPLDENGILEARLRECETALGGLEARVNEIRDLLRDPAVDRVPVRAIQRGEAEVKGLEARIKELEGLIGTSRSEIRGESDIEIAGATVREAARRYKSLFLDRRANDRMRVEALEMLGRFPRRYEAIDPRVMEEIEFALRSTESSEMLVRRLVLMIRNRRWQGAWRQLHTVVASKRFSRSTRAAALVGFRDLVHDPEARAGLAGLAGTLGSEELEQLLKSVLEGRAPRPRGKKASGK